MRKSRFSQEQMIAILTESEAGVGTEELQYRTPVEFAAQAASFCRAGLG